MTNRRSVDEDFLGNFESVAELERQYPAVERSGKCASVTVSGRDVQFVCDGSAWNAVVTAPAGAIPGTGWKDLVSPLTTAGIAANNQPTMTAFGPSGLREELAFDINDYVFCQPFHVNHDVKPGGLAYIHVHWSTNGTSTATVKWELQVSRALGHNQANFPAPTSLYVTQAAHGTAWRHMVAEVSLADALTLTEPDELVQVTLRRVTNGGTDNANTVFGLTVDFHYESDRDVTPNKAPNFYA